MTSNSSVRVGNEISTRKAGGKAEKGCLNASGIEQEMKVVRKDNVERRPSQIFGKVLFQMTKVSDGSKLYGRENEREALVRCWKRCCETKHQEIVVISGSPGTGKSTLADALRHIVDFEQSKAFFLSGKYAESTHHRKGPFEVFAAAFTSYVDQLLDSKDLALLERSKAQLQSAVRKDPEVLISMIPALEKIMDGCHFKRGELVDRCDSGFRTQLYGRELANRLKNAFANLVAAISSCSPLVLFLDDLQWADRSSLDLLRNIILSEVSMPLLLVATVRPVTYEPQESNAAISVIPLEQRFTYNHFDFTEFLKEFDNHPTLRLTVIDLYNLTLDHVQLLVASVLKKDPKDVRELSQMVHEQTLGNPFHLLQFLRSLVEEVIIERVGDAWVLHDASSQIHMGSPDSVLALVVRSIRSLPKPVQEALKIASCLGDEVDASAIDLVMEAPCETLLQQASDEGLLVFSSRYGGYRFAQNWIRHAAYSLIPQEEVRKFHLNIGRRLWQNSSAAVVQENVSLIASLLNLGAEHIQDPAERYKVAELNLKAARKMMLLPSFLDAARYLRSGIGFLGQNCWTDHYKLTLDLYSNASEIEALNGNFDLVAQCIDEIVQHGATLDDKLQAYAALLFSMEQQDDLGEALNVCMDVLRQLGEKLPSKASKLVVVQEYFRVRWKLRGKSNKDILDLPPMKDQRKIQCMEFLVTAYGLAWKAKSPMCVFFGLRGILLTLRYGMHPTAAIAFAMYAFSLCGLHIDVKEGYRFGKLALSIAEKSNSPNIISQTYMIVGCSASHWTHPLSESLDTLAYAATVGLESGYVAFGMTAKFLFCTVARIMGQELSTLQTNLKQVLKLSRLHHNPMMQTNCSSILQAIDCYDGTSNDPAQLTGTWINFDERIRECKESHQVVIVNVLYFNAMEVAYMHGNLARAAEMMAEIIVDKSNPSAMLFSAIMQIEMALVSIALCRIGVNQSQNMKRAKESTKDAIQWAKDGPTTFAHWKLLLEAEFLSLKKKGCRQKDKVCRLYARALEHAERQGNPMCMALICEKWGDYHCDVQGEKKEAVAQWIKAADLYQKWGSVTLYRKLRQKVDVSRNS